MWKTEENQKYFDKKGCAHKKSITKQTYVYGLKETNPFNLVQMKRRMKIKPVRRKENSRV